MNRYCSTGAVEGATVPVLLLVMIQSARWFHFRSELMDLPLERATVGLWPSSLFLMGAGGVGQQNFGSSEFREKSIMQHAKSTRSLRPRIAVCASFTQAVLFLSAYNGEASEMITGDIAVSMVTLLSRPTDADGHIVQVIGYLERGVDLRLFLTKDHAKLSDVTSSIAIRDPAENEDDLSKCAGSYAFVVGKYGRSGYGYFEILEVLGINRWEPDSGEYVTCWKRRRSPR